MRKLLVVVLVVGVLGAAYAALYAQGHKLDDGTLGTKVVPFDQSGAPASDNAAATVTALEELVDNANIDPAHDGAASANGPQVQGECDDTSTDAVDEGDAGRMRIQCTTRALMTTPGGETVGYRVSAGSTEDEHQVKGTAGVLMSVVLSNANAAIRYWRCSNLTAANTTPGTSAVFMATAIPANAAPVTLTFPGGAAFDTALTCWFVTGAAESDVAEVAANELRAVYTYR